MAVKYKIKRYMAISILTIILPIKASSAIEPRRDLVVASQCESDLTVYPIPHERVFDLGQNFQPHQSALENDEEVIALSQRQLHVDLPGSSLKVYQEDVNNLVLVDKATGRRVVDDSILVAAANEYFSRIGAGRVTCLESRFSAFIRSTATVAFSAASSSSENHVLLYNYATGETTGIVRESGKVSEMRWVEVVHDRFVSSYFTTGQQGFALHSFYDLVSGKNIEISVPGLTTVRISDDGARMFG